MLPATRFNIKEMSYFTGLSSLLLLLLTNIYQAFSSRYIYITTLTSVYLL